MGTIIFITSVLIFLYALSLVRKKTSASTNKGFQQAAKPEAKARTKTFRPLAATDIEPKHKPVGKSSAKQIYEDVIKEAKPGIEPEKLSYFCEKFESSIESYLSCLEMLAPSVELHDIDNDLDILHDSLIDVEDEEMPPTAEEIKENKAVLKRIKKLNAQREVLIHRMEFFNQKDLRYLVALELNQLLAPELHNIEISYEQLILAAAKNHASNQNAG